MVKPEIPVLCHFVWEASENMDCDLRRCYFKLFHVSLADVDILYYSDLHSRNLAFNCLMFMPQISNQMVFVGGKYPRGKVASEEP